MEKMKTRKLVLTALFTALIAGSSLFTIPVGPVPVVLTTTFVVLSGMLGGPGIGLSAVACYLILGLIGLPVFAGGTAGMARLVGPTGGFLAGYLLAAAAGILYPYKPGISRVRQTLRALAAAFIAGALIYLPGLAWLKHSLSLEWKQTLQAGLLPFIPGYIIKSLTAALLARALKDRFQEFLRKEEA